MADKDVERRTGLEEDESEQVFGKLLKTLKTPTKDEAPPPLPKGEPGPTEEEE